MQKTVTLPVSPAVCSECVTITVEDGIVTSAGFRGGCPGNLAGISQLVAGMPVQEVIRRLRGIRCGAKATSCPDQLARLLEEHFS